MLAPEKATDSTAYPRAKGAEPAGSGMEKPVGGVLGVGARKPVAPGHPAFSARSPRWWWGEARPWRTPAGLPSPAAWAAARPPKENDAGSGGLPVSTA